jgi:hypothetical protein
MERAVGRLVIAKELVGRRIEAGLFVVFDTGLKLDRGCLAAKIGSEVGGELPDNQAPLFDVARRAPPPPRSHLGRAAIRCRQIPRHVFERDRDVA